MYGENPFLTIHDKSFLLSCQSLILIFSSLFSKPHIGIY